VYSSQPSQFFYWWNTPERRGPSLKNAPGMENIKLHFSGFLKIVSGKRGVLSNLIDWNTPGQAPCA